MGQHATIHGKNTTPVNGASGSWVPISVTSTGALDLSNMPGNITGVGRTAGGAIVNYTIITTNTTTVIKSGTAIYAGIVVHTAGTTSTVTVYDNTAASGQTFVNAAATTAVGDVANDAVPAGMQVLFTTGLTVVTAGAAAAATIIVYWV